jgi:fructokinase
LVNRIGVDLGGTKIEAVALTPDGAELGRQRVRTPSGDYRHIIEAIADLVARVDGIAAPTAETVGIGTPGAISRVAGVIKNSNSTVLNGRPLHRDLSRALDRPVVMRNDADCFALSEARDGAGAGASVVMGVIIGTGVGGGIVVDGKTLSGPSGVAGEWGHNQLPWAQPPDLPGAPCYCGKRGCIETFLSGPGFERDFRETTGRTLPAPQIVEEARSGGVEANIALRLYADRLARSLASIINVLDPDVVVAGGGMSNVTEIYELVPQRWSPYVFGGEVGTRLVPNMHGDSSGVRGAAWLVEP